MLKYLDADHENDTIYRTTGDQTANKLEEVHVMTLHANLE
jgi:hypothetical protein